MAFAKKLIALIAFCYLLCNGLTNGRSKGLKMEKRKGTIKTIRSENGEVIDCVDIHQQPSFDHPLLMNHTIEMSPDGHDCEEDERTVNFQAWHKNGEYCPKGSVPIVRTEEDERTVNASFADTKSVINPSGRQYALAYSVGHFQGTNATLNVWSPAVEGDGEYSTGQIWVIAGNGEIRNTIEAGWIVKFYDRNPKIFIRWTRDNYVSTGCFNFHCPGFVQVSRKAAIGVAIHPISTYNGPQYDITVSIARNLRTGNWWLRVHNIPIGYWPNFIFTTLSGGSDQLRWGGEVLNKGLGGNHTTTQMGSSRFPDEGFRRASFVRNIQYKNGAGVYKDPEYIYRYASNPSCYDSNLRKNGPLTGVHLYYGGPGLSDKCRF